jgi:hypothetical protein
MNMAYIEFNNNPVGRKVGDCAVRAISKALDMGWEAAYIALTINGLQMGDMPNNDVVSSALLRMHGYRRMNIPNDCPMCYSVEDFCADHPHGRYVLYCGGHVVTAIDGDWFDSWDSGSLIVQSVWYRKENE